MLFRPCVSVADKDEISNFLHSLFWLWWSWRLVCCLACFIGKAGRLWLFIRFIFKEYMVNKGNDSVFHLQNIRDEGMYWIFRYVKEAIVQLDNTP